VNAPSEAILGTTDSWRFGLQLKALGAVFAAEFEKAGAADWLNHITACATRSLAFSPDDDSVGGGR